MDRAQMYNSIVSYLKKAFPEGRVVSTGNEYVCRCRFCGDSTKDYNAKHFYIALNKEALLYHCYKCNASGVLTPEILSQLTEIEPEVMGIIKGFNKGYNIKSLHSRSMTKKMKPLYIQAMNTKQNIEKYKYIISRIDYKLQPLDLAKLKIIINLEDTLRYNNIPVSNYNLMKSISDTSVGFLSIDNTMVKARYLSNKKFRYTMYRIYPQLQDSLGYYAIPVLINPLQHVNIVIAEGVFDILSIYCNLYNCDNSNTIFIAIGSKAYTTVMEYILLSYGFIDMEYNIYIDNDLSKYEIFKIRDYGKQYNIQTTIHRNSYRNEKDFGVPRDRIIDTIL